MKLGLYYTFIMNGAISHEHLSSLVCMKRFCIFSLGSFSIIADSCQNHFHNNKMRWQYDYTISPCFVVPYAKFLGKDIQWCRNQITSMIFLTFEARYWSQMVLPESKIEIIRESSIKVFLNDKENCSKGSFQLSW